MFPPLRNTPWIVFLTLLPQLFVAAAAGNITIDDSDFDRIIYWMDTQWSHDPLLGYESFFVNGTRSYTDVPGASAIFSFTGTGVYLQGLFSSDEAIRNVTLDGQDMGKVNAYSAEQLPSEGSSKIFWGKSGLENKAHTVAVMHADTAGKVLTMDAWIFEVDSSQTQGTSLINLGPSTAPSPAATVYNIGASSTSMSSNVGFIVGPIVALALVLFCVAGFCFYRRRRQRAQRRQSMLSREKGFPWVGPGEDVYPAPVVPNPIPTQRRPTTGSSMSSSSLSAAEVAVAHTASVTTLPSRRFYRYKRTAPNPYIHDTRGLVNYQLFVQTTSRTDLADSRSSTPIPHNGSKPLFEQQPDLPTSSDYSHQPVVNAPASSLFRRLSTTLANVVASKIPPWGSNSQLNQTNGPTEFKYNAVNAEATADTNDPQPDAESTVDAHAQDPDFALTTFLPHMSSPSTIDVPLSPASTVTVGFGRQSANLEKLVDSRFDNRVSNTSTLASAATTSNRTHREPERWDWADPFDDDYAFSSYTRSTKEEVIRFRPFSDISTEESHESH